MKKSRNWQKYGGGGIDYNYNNGDAVMASPITQNICYGLFCYSLLAMALMKSSLLSTVGFSMVVINARSLVISPDSMVSMVAFSSLPAKSISAWLLSSSPRLRRAPVQAKMVATELVEVSSPFKCL